MYLTPTTQDGLQPLRPWFSLLLTIFLHGMSLANASALIESQGVGANFLVGFDGGRGADWTLLVVGVWL
jgi:hypothetical protein